jgi:O-antigen/teichoic acid export membrane protein
MRTKTSIYNFLTSYIPYIMLTFLGFLKINLFLNNLGEDVFALNQLYINVFAYLAITEAGAGVALIYRLYKPLALKKQREINSLYAGSKIIFKNVGFLMIIIGFIISFGLPLLIKENNFGNIFIQITFMLFVVKNSIDYFMFTPQFVIQADQKMYKINIIISLFRFIETVTEIILIILGINYFIILIPGIFIKILQNIFVNKKIFKSYAWLNEKGNKDFSIKSDIKHLLSRKFVGLISNNIDIVILSSFVGAGAVAIYAGYNYLVKFATDTIRQFTNAIKNSFGNVIQIEGIKKIRIIFDEYFILFNYIATLIVIVFYFVLDEFISIWIGNGYIISDIGLYLFLINLYFYTTIKIMSAIIDSLGLFQQTKKMLTIEALINLILSIIFVNFFELEGVLLATVISFFVTNFWYYPYLINKMLLKSNLNNYVVKYIINVIITLGLIVLLQPIYSNFSCDFFSVPLLNWVFNSFLITIVVFAFLFVIYYAIYSSYRNIITRILSLVWRK